MKPMASLDEHSRIKYKKDMMRYSCVMLFTQIKQVKQVKSTQILHIMSISSCLRQKLLTYNRYIS